MAFVRFCHSAVLYWLQNLRQMMSGELCSWIPGNREPERRHTVEQKVTPTVRTTCPDCGEKISLKGTIRMGQEVICPHCDAELEVVETDPVELDWAYYDEYESDEEEEDEDW